MVNGAFFIMKGENYMHSQSVVVNLESPWTINNGRATAPCVIMREGVHNGSHGAIYHDARILRANASKWEGIPIAINHPQINGKNVSIKELPQVIIGHVRRPYFCETKKAIRAFIEIPYNHPQISQIQQVKEISAGLFTDDYAEAGQWNGEDYRACAITHEPDHLALLPGGRGACSWADGCGIRTNGTGYKLYDAITNAVLNYFKGELNMNSNEILMPTGCNPKNDDAAAIRRLQAEAEKSGILLPTKFNTTGRAGIIQRGADDSEILMPTGFEGGK